MSDKTYLNSSKNSNKFQDTTICVHSFTASSNAYIFVSITEPVSIYRFKDYHAVHSYMGHTVYL